MIAMPPGTVRLRKWRLVILARPASKVLEDCLCDRVGGIVGRLGSRCCSEARGCAGSPPAFGGVMILRGDLAPDLATAHGVPLRNWPRLSFDQ